MSFFRIKTIKDRQYLYKQTSVREGKKVKSIMEYVGALGGHFTSSGRSVPNRNADLQATQNPKRPDYNQEYRQNLFKTDRPAFDRLQMQDALKAQASKESRAAWKDKQVSRGEKTARAEASRAADEKWKETMEVVREFSEAREAEKKG